MTDTVDVDSATRLFSDEIARVHRVATDVINWLMLNKAPDRKGAVVCISGNHDGLPLFALRIKGLDPAKAAEQIRFSVEKATRLGSNDAHLSSAQSRDEESKLYDGAIRCRECIVSVSGFWPDSLDATAAIVIALLLGKLSEGEAEIRGQLSDRSCWSECYQALKPEDRWQESR